MVLDHQGQLAEAEAMLREALTMKRKLLGNDADVSAQLHNLATTLTSRGRLAEAETVHREALAMIKKLVGNEHEDVALSLNNLGVEGQGKLDEAETMLREALAMHEKVSGKEFRITGYRPRRRQPDRQFPHRGGPQLHALAVGHTL